MRKCFRWLGIAMQLGAVLGVCAAPAKEPQMLLEENFDRYAEGTGVPEGWWVEGGEKVWIEKGHLRVQANPKDGKISADKHETVCTVWCPKEIKGDACIEFDACVLASETDVRNINFFFYYRDPAGKPLAETKAQRQDGAYDRYHGLDGYILTFLADVPKSRQYHPDGTAKARLRLRRCPGFQLADETYDYHCEIGRVYHVKLVREGGQVTCAIDGKVYLRWQDPKPLEAGLVGFRTFRTDLWFDNLKVTER